MPDPVPRQPSLPPIEPGAVLAEKYRVERIIGKGGMGVVVEARHIALDERVALKFLLPEYASHPEASARFLREARAAVKIKSEHVARVSDVGTLDTGAPYMVMELLVGNDLAKVLEQQGKLSLEDAVDYVVQGCEAIADAHANGIVHRDLKPANLFLTRRVDGSPLVKVLDFGISKVMSQGVDNLTRTAAAMGSALYMSPEQMQQTRSVDHRTDIYALGVALYELLAGKQPYYADTLPQLCAEVLTGKPTPLRAARPDIPQAFATVLEKAYARDRGHRYQSIAELVVALAPFAPARSRPTIDRIARMGGLTPPAVGGQMAQPAGATPIPQAVRQGGTVPMPVYEEGRPSPAPPGYPAPLAPHPSYAVAPAPSPSAVPAGTQGHGVPMGTQGHGVPMGTQGHGVPMGTQGHGVPMGTQGHGVPMGVQPPATGLQITDMASVNQIVPGPYTAPMSARARATFAGGAVLGVPTSGRPARSTAAVIAIVAAAVAVGAVIGFITLRSPAADTSAAGPASSAQPSAEVPSAAPSADVPPATPPATGVAATSASAEPSGSPVAAASTAAPAAPPTRARTTSVVTAPVHRVPRPAPTPKPATSIDLNDPH